MVASWEGVLADGQDVSIALVQAGLAWHYTKYSSNPALAQAGFGSDQILISAARAVFSAIRDLELGTVRDGLPRQSEEPCLPCAVVPLLLV